MKPQVLALFALGISPALAQTSIRRIDPAFDKLISPNAKVEKVADGFQFV